MFTFSCCCCISTGISWDSALEKLMNECTHYIDSFHQKTKSVEDSYKWVKAIEWKYLALMSASLFSSVSLCRRICNSSKRLWRCVYVSRSTCWFKLNTIQWDLKKKRKKAHIDYLFALLSQEKLVCQIYIDRKQFIC